MLLGFAKGMSCQRGRVGHDLCHGTRGDDFTAASPGTWAEIDDAVGSAHGFLIMLDHHERVAFCCETLQRIEELFVVAWMEPDRRLVEHVKNTTKVRSKLGCEANSLGFAAAERLRATIQGKVIKANFGKELEALANFRNDVSCDFCRAAGEDQFIAEIKGVGRGRFGEIGDRVLLKKDIGRGFVETGAFADWAGTWFFVL